MAVGFSQRIQLAWLEQTAAGMMSGQSRVQIEAALQEHLRDRLSVGGDAERGTREKAITILLKIWVSVPEGLESFRDEGLDHLRRLPASEHLAVHWGMTLAVYPFVGTVAETVGRLLRLQGAASAAQVQRRMREQLGQRTTVARAVRRVLRSFIDWGVLLETGAKGTYRGTPARLVEDRRLGAWLIEAALIASGSDLAPLAAIAGTPALFPFTLSLTGGPGLVENPRIEYLRQGLDEEIITRKLNPRPARQG
ncbi:MAG: hypothetical protein JXM73_07760 [Anaerolineae bacterium]|nr:hypothetical protein [Anaerolineae bacterium]